VQIKGVEDENGQSEYADYPERGKGKDAAGHCFHPAAANQKRGQSKSQQRGKHDSYAYTQSGFRRGKAQQSQPQSGNKKADPYFRLPGPVAGHPMSIRSRRAKFKYKLGGQGNKQSGHNRARAADNPIFHLQLCFW
jgi:hypothetical protein